LEKRLTQLQPDSSQSAIVVATAGAIESKIADLEVHYAQDQAKFSDSHPTLQLRKAQIEALRQRLTTLQ
jgi:capsule polysaccharide export protein KpsE/RkpR